MRSKLKAFVEHFFSSILSIVGTFHIPIFLGLRVKSLHCFQSSFIQLCSFFFLFYVHLVTGLSIAESFLLAALLDCVFFCHKDLRIRLVVVHTFFPISNSDTTLPVATY